MFYYLKLVLSQQLVQHLPQHRQQRAAAARRPGAHLHDGLELPNLEGASTGLGHLEVSRNGTLSASMSQAGDALASYMQKFAVSAWHAAWLVCWLHRKE